MCCEKIDVKEKSIYEQVGIDEDSDLFCFLLFFLASVNKTLWGRPIKSSFVLSSHFYAQSYSRLNSDFQSLSDR